MLRRRPTILLAAVALVAGVGVLALGIWIGGRHATAVPKPVRTALTGDDAGRVVAEAIDRINHTYYREVPKSRLADDAIAGAVAKLNDRFSNYFSPTEYRRFQQAQDSQFVGVGVTVAEEPRGLRLEQVFDGSPAKRAGMVRGDVITGVDGKPLKGLSSAQATALIRGPAGSDVVLTVEHGGRSRDERLTRSAIAVPVVASTMREVCGRKIGVVALSTFSSGAHGEVIAALKRLKARGAQAYVFDLRENGGGLVDEAQLVASQFLSSGTVVTTRGRTVAESTLKATGSPVVPKAPLVVLVDGNTASASEIVAGALQDHHRAELVGTRTFGKGVFQEVIELSNHGALDITAGQYFTPNGRNLGGRGVATGAGLQPDVKAKDDPKTKRDEGLDTALDTVAAKAGCRPGASS